MMTRMHDQRMAKIGAPIKNTVIALEGLNILLRSSPTESLGTGNAMIPNTPAMMLNSTARLSWSSGMSCSGVPVPCATAADSTLL